MFSAPIFNMLSLCYFKLNTDLKWSANYYILFLFAFYTANQLFLGWGGYWFVCFACVLHILSCLFWLFAEAVD